MSDSYSAPSNGLLRKFSSKSNEILIKFAQIFILTIFKLLKAQYTCSFLLLTGYSWLLTRYFWLLNRYYWLLLVTSGYSSLLLVTSGSSFCTNAFRTSLIIKED